MSVFTLVGCTPVDPDALRRQLQGEVVHIVRDDLLGESVARPPQPASIPPLFDAESAAAIDPVTTIDAPDCRCLMLECTRLSTPTRSTSTASTNAWIPDPAVSGAMPALATTTSEGAELGNAPIDRRRKGHAVTNIGDLSEGALALLLDQPSRLLEVLGPRERVLVGRDVRADVHCDDVGAFCRQHLRVRPPLASRRSADQHDLARYFCPSLAFPQNVNTSDRRAGRSCSRSSTAEWGNRCGARSSQIRLTHRLRLDALVPQHLRGVGAHNGRRGHPAASPDQTKAYDIERPIHEVPELIVVKP